MSVKKMIPGLLLTAILFTTAPAMAASGTDPVTTTSPVTGEDPRAQQLMQRLEDIKSMDKSTLSSSEKKDLRKEVRGIRKEMKQISGGVYLSVGAIIIVILLLILLL